MIITNKQHAFLARDTLKFFANTTRQINEPLDTNMTDLLADMMHLCDLNKLNFYTLLRQAITHYHEECIDENFKRK